jgi:ribosomal protein L37AE/L43A
MVAVITRKYKTTLVSVVPILFSTYTILFSSFRIFSCRRCGPGFAASSFEDIVKTLAVAVKGGDFENTLTAKCAASASCPAFATLTKIKVTYLSDALHAVPKVSSNAVVALGQDKKYFRKTFKVMLKYQGGSGVPTDESCFPIFDDVFVSVYNDVNAGEDTQIETCFVTSVTPGLFEKPSSVRGVSVEGGNYYYNSNGDWTCRRCGGNLQGVGGDKDLEGALLDAMVSASSACFNGLSSVKVVLNTEAANE